MRKAFYILLFCYLNLGLLGQDLTDGLLVHYPLDGHVMDASGNGFDGINFGATASKDRFGNDNACFLFKNSVYIDFPNEIALKPDLPFTISVWFQATSFESEANFSIVGTDMALDNYYGAFITILGIPHTLLVGYGDGTGCTSIPCRRAVISSDAILINKWHHVVATFKSSEEIAIFLNGCEVPSIPSGTGSGNVIYSDIPGSIGRNDHSDTPGVPLSFFEGKIDDFYFWNRILSEEEILLVYDNFYPSSESIEGYQGCTGDNYQVEVNGTIYNENNPTGIEVFPNASGCDSIVQIDLKYEYCPPPLICELIAPSAFSPNNDGVNDTFEVFFSGDCSYPFYEISIYDRWGKKVFEGNQDILWNGKSESNASGIGVYSYLIKYKKGTENTFKSGNVSLIK